MHAARGVQSEPAPQAFGKVFISGPARFSVVNCAELPFNYNTKMHCKPQLYLYFGF
jgi:hypothetical protein